MLHIIKIVQNVKKRPILINKRVVQTKEASLDKLCKIMTSFKKAA